MSQISTQNKRYYIQNILYILYIFHNITQWCGPS